MNLLFVYRLTSFTVIYFGACFVLFSTENIHIEIVDNKPLTEKAIYISRDLESDVRPRDNLNRFPLDLSEEVQRNTLVHQIEPIYTTTQIKCLFKPHAGDDRQRDRTGTGFFVLDRSKVLEGACRPFNLAISEAYKNNNHLPHTFLITNRHVLNINGEPFRDEHGTTWNKTHYSFYVHLVKHVTTKKRCLNQLDGGDCHFKTAHITFPLSALDIHDLPDLYVNNTVGKIDLSALNLTPYLKALRDHIVHTPDLVPIVGTRQKVHGLNISLSNTKVYKG